MPPTTPSLHPPFRPCCGGTRQYSVSLPREYERRPGAQFPMLYLLDGRKSLLEVVSITRARAGSISDSPSSSSRCTTDRMRDYTRPHHDLAQWGTGEASYAVTGRPQFLRYLGGNCAPSSGGFRTQAPALLVGHSSAACWRSIPWRNGGQFRGDRRRRQPLVRLSRNYSASRRVDRALRHASRCLWRWPATFTRDSGARRFTGSPAAFARRVVGHPAQPARHQPLPSWGGCHSVL